MKSKRDWSAFECRPKSATPYRPRVAQAARKKSGYSLRYVAERLGIAHPTVLSWESGKHNPPEWAVIRMARLYGRDDLG